MSGETNHARVLRVQQERVDGHLCLCGCGTALPTKFESGERVLVVRRQRAASVRCRDRAYVQRMDALAADGGVPTRGRRLAADGLHASIRSSERRDDAPSARKPREVKRREGVSVYFPTLKLAKAVRLALAGVPEGRKAVNDAIRRRETRDARARERAAA